jgi:hypothetical protein
VLAQLHDRLTPRLLASIPSVVAMVPSEHGRALVSTAMPGAPLTTRYHRWRHVSRRTAVERDFAIAGHWLTRLQTVSATDPAPVDFAGELRGEFRHRFSAAPEFDRVARRLEAVHDRLQGARTARTVVHGDYWPGNVLTDGGRVCGVVDWEAASAAGEPIRDVVRFVLGYALYLDRHTRAGRTVAGHPGLRAGSWGAGVRFAIDGDGWFPRLVREFTVAHLRRLGVAPARWRDVLLAGVAECATAADEPEFARHHFELLASLARVEHRSGARGA